MNAMHMIEISPDWKKLIRFLHVHRLLGKESDGDLGYGIHAWLKAAFGEFTPKPWRLLTIQHRPHRLLGYSIYPASTLKRHIQEFADPLVYAACSEQNIADRVMPWFHPGRRLAFEVTGCPVGRQSRTQVEKDLFLLHAACQANHDPVLSRESLYCQWATKQLEQTNGVEVASIQLVGFRLTRQVRRAEIEEQHQKRRKQIITKPWALFRGTMVVTDSKAFFDLLLRGIGRHRAFGYGMVLLKPSS